MADVLSMLDQMLIRLPCGHDTVLGRLRNRDTWTCEDCGKKVDLTEESWKSDLAKDFDTANQIDLQERSRGNTVRRADQ
jgi:hypothetical protein